MPRSTTPGTADTRGAGTPAAVGDHLDELALGDGGALSARAGRSSTGPVRAAATIIAAARSGT